jgi:hypothetical protein
MRRIARALFSLVRGVVLGLRDTCVLGGRTLLVAPALVAVAAVPEFVQHVAEINMGMFDSRAMAASLANGAVRWSFGYAKIAGLVLAILLAARFWAKGSLRETFRIAPLRLAKLVAVAAAMVLSGGAISAAGDRLWPAGAALFTAVATVIQFGILVWLVGLLVDDPAISLRRAFLSRLPTAALILFLVLAAFLPGQALHGLDHRLALEQARPVVWALMAFDSLVVGMMAATVGAALHVGYRSGASWRGWRPEPLSPGPT